MATHDYEVVIIGAGPAGMCAALYAGRSMLRTVIIERGAPGGELLNTELIEDYIGFEHILEPKSLLSAIDPGVENYDV